MFESFVAGLICMSIVFLVLAALFAMISILSKLMSVASGKKAAGINTDKVRSVNGSAANGITAANTVPQTAKVRPAAVGAPAAVQIPATAAVKSAASSVPSAASGRAGGLKLNNVDERTAAMIMAIVSHETKIPLNELVFRSISAIGR